MNHNFTRTSAPTPEELSERQAWYDEQMAEAAKVNEQFMLAKSQQDAAVFQDKLLAATNQSLETMIGIREWLKHNPSQASQPLAGIVESYTEIR